MIGTNFKNLSTKLLLAFFRSMNIDITTLHILNFIHFWLLNSSIVKKCKWNKLLMVQWQMDVSKKLKY